MAFYQNQTDLGKVFEARVFGPSPKDPSALWAEILPSREGVVIPKHTESAAYVEAWNSIRDRAKKNSAQVIVSVRNVVKGVKHDACDLVQKIEDRYVAYEGVETKLSVAGISRLYLPSDPKLQQGDIIKNVYLTSKNIGRDLAVLGYDGRLIRAQFTADYEPGLYDIEIIAVPNVYALPLVARVVAAHKF